MIVSSLFVSDPTDNFEPCEPQTATVLTNACARSFLKSLSLAQSLASK